MINNTIFIVALEEAILYIVSYIIFIYFFLCFNNSLKIFLFVKLFALELRLFQLSTFCFIASVNKKNGLWVRRYIMAKSIALTTSKIMYTLGSGFVS